MKCGREFIRKKLEYMKAKPKKIMMISFAAAVSNTLMLLLLLLCNTNGQQASSLSFEISLDGQVSTVAFDAFHNLSDQARQILHQIPGLAGAMGNCAGEEDCAAGMLVEAMEGVGESRASFLSPKRRLTNSACMHSINP